MGLVDGPGGAADISLDPDLTVGGVIEQLQNPSSAVGALKNLLPSDSPINDFLDAYNDVDQALQAAAALGIPIPDVITTNLAQAGVGLYGAPGTWTGAGPAQGWSAGNFLSGAGGAGILSAAGVLLQGGDLGQAALTGGLSALGFAVAGPIGSIIGSFLANADFKGGSRDNTKLPKTVDIFRNQGVEEGYKRLDSVISGQLWPGETGTNIQYVINPFLEMGLLNSYYPAFHSSDSIVNLWDSSKDITGNANILLNASYGYQKDFKTGEFTSDLMDAANGGTDYRGISNRVNTIWNQALDSSKLMGTAAYDYYLNNSFASPNTQSMFKSYAKSYGALKPEIAAWENGSASEKLAWDILWKGDMSPVTTEYYRDKLENDPNYKKTFDDALVILGENNLSNVGDSIVRSLNVRYDNAVNVKNELDRTGWAGDTTKLDEYLNSGFQRYTYPAYVTQSTQAARDRAATDEATRIANNGAITLTNAEVTSFRNNPGMVDIIYGSVPETLQYVKSTYGL